MNVTQVVQCQNWSKMNSWRKKGGPRWKWTFFLPVIVHSCWIIQGPPGKNGNYDRATEAQKGRDYFRPRSQKKSTSWSQKRWHTWSKKGKSKIARRPFPFNGHLAVSISCLVAGKMESEITFSPVFARGFETIYKSDPMWSILREGASNQHWL